MVEEHFWEDKRKEMEQELRETIKKYNKHFAHQIIKEEMDKIFKEREHIL